MALSSSAGATPCAGAGECVYNPSAVIGSTSGTGPQGCVSGSKLVAFRIDLGGHYLFGVWTYLYRQRVLVDGRAVYAKGSVGNPVQADRNPSASALSRFKVRIDLSHARAGKHRVSLVGETALIPKRRSTGHLSSGSTPPTPPAFRNGRVWTSKLITKCAATSFAG